jgi:hypothetical protein
MANDAERHRKHVTTQQQVTEGRRTQQNRPQRWGCFGRPKRKWIRNESVNRIDTLKLKEYKRSKVATL